MFNSKIIPTLLISVGISTIVISPIQAQGINGKPADTFQSNEVNPLYGTSGFNPMDLIHNANLLNGRNSADFADDTNRNLDNAADDFRRQQLERMMELQQQQNTSPSTSNDNMVAP